MNEQEHLKRVLSDIRAKSMVAKNQSVEQRIMAESFDEAAEVIEDELRRFPKASQ